MPSAHEIFISRGHFLNRAALSRGEGNVVIFLNDAAAFHHKIGVPWNFIISDFWHITEMAFSSRDWLFPSLLKF
jgi:hypothetical protein